MLQERIASFQRTLDRCHSQAQSLEASIQAIWQGIFSARFRDVDADIRATVIHGIGDWIAMNPADFLTDHYLKYVAWALSDRVGAAEFAFLQRWGRTCAYLAPDPCCACAFCVF